jgi:hypothetical protein
LLGGLRISAIVAGEASRNIVHGRHQGACNSQRNVSAQLPEQVRESLTSVRV